MFLRQSHRKNKNGSVTAYYSLAESVRVSDKKNPATRIVHNFGRADKVDVESLKRLVDSINRVIDGAGGSDPSDLKSFEEFLLSQRLGVPLVASSIFERMGLGEIIGIPILCESESQCFANLRPNQCEYTAFELFARMEQTRHFCVS